MESYTHRNGETQPPTLNGAFYWFWGLDHPDAPDIFGMLFVVDTIAHTADGEEYVLEDLTGRWWGPVAAPWGDDA